LGLASLAWVACDGKDGAAQDGGAANPQVDAGAEVDGGKAAQVLASVEFVDGLSLNGDFVYLTSSPRPQLRWGMISRVPKVGGELEEIFRDYDDFASFAVVDETQIFWVSGGYEVRRMDKAGGPWTKVANNKGFGAGLWVYELLIDRSNVYWTESWKIPRWWDEAPDPYPNLGRVLKAPKDGGDQVVLASGPTVMAPHSLALFKDHVYWADADAQTISRVAKAGGLVEVIASGLGEKERYAPMGPSIWLAVDSTGVYWSSRVDSTASMASSLDGGLLVPVRALDLPAGFLMDQSHFFWSTGKAMWKMPKSGGEAQLLADRLSDGRQVSAFILQALDEEFVYFMDQGPAEWGPSGVIPGKDGFVGRVSKN